MSIVLRTLGVGYGRLPVLEDVTATAAAGRVTALVGPNAAGKSTLLRCVVGALTPVTGEVLIDDVPVTRLRGRALARRVAYVPQRPTLAMPFTVREVVELGRYALELDGARVESALERLALTAIADRPFPALSVGQQQRVAVARAYAQLDPAATLVLDEPTAAMDLRHARDCFALLREVADAGVAVLVAMHDLAAGAASADDAWLLAADREAQPARLRAAGPVAEVLTPTGLEAVFGVPFEWIERAGGRRTLVASPPDDRG